VSDKACKPLCGEQQHPLLQISQYSWHPAALTGKKMKQMLIVASLILTGCVQSAPRTPADDLFASYKTRQQNGDTHSGIQEYFVRVHSAMMSHIREPEAYAGKSCRLHISLNRAARLTAISTVKGDPAMCRAMTRAVRETTFPPIPDENIYQQMQDASLDFAF